MLVPLMDSDLKLLCLDSQFILIGPGARCLTNNGKTYFSLRKHSKQELKAGATGFEVHALLFGLGMTSET